MVGSEQGLSCTYHHFSRCELLRDWVNIVDGGGGMHNVIDHQSLAAIDKQSSVG